jgi:ATP-binding cassette subfamily C protein
VDVSGGSPQTLASVGTRAMTRLGLSHRVEVVLAVYALIIVTQALIFRWQTMVNLGIEFGLVADLRGRLFEAVTRARWPFLARTRTADISHALTTDLDRAGLATYQMLWILTSTGVVVAQVVLALRVSWPLTLLVFAAGALLLLTVGPRVRSSGHAGEAISAATADVHAMAVEQLAGMKTVKSQATEHASVREFRWLSDRVAHAALRAARTQADARAIFETGAVVMMAGLLVVGLRVFVASPAALFLLIFLFVRLMPRASALQQGVHQYVASLPALAEVEAVQARCTAEAEAIVRPGRQIALRRSLRLERASFEYETDRPVLRDLSVTFPAGQTTGIVGPSGCGKTTLADVVMGLLQPDTGAVLVDDQPLSSETMAAWRDGIGYVSQDTFFFHDTVAANLRVGAPDATDADLVRVLGLAAAEFVLALPDGLNTVVGDRGVRLSGGERQRLALARALVRNPQLLILDEPTSALDAPNERRIVDAIAGLRGRMTILLITHRVWTLDGVDTIVVLDAGRLVESGRSDTLRATAGSRFAALSLDGER